MTCFCLHARAQRGNYFWPIDWYAVERPYIVEGTVESVRWINCRIRIDQWIKGKSLRKHHLKFRYTFMWTHPAEEKVKSGLEKGKHYIFFLLDRYIFGEPLILHSRYHHLPVVNDTVFIDEGFFRWVEIPDSIDICQPNPHPDPIVKYGYPMVKSEFIELIQILNAHYYYRLGKERKKAKRYGRAEPWCTVKIQDPPNNLDPVRQALVDHFEGWWEKSHCR